MTSATDKPRTPRQRHRSHPAEVTAVRLLTHYEKWFSRFSGEERDMIAKIRHALYRIADEDEEG